VSLPAGPRAPAFLQLGHYSVRPLRWLTGLQQRHGNVFTVRLPLFPAPLVMVGEPALVKEIFAADGETLHSGELNTLLGELLGSESLILQDGEAHARSRKVLLPPFHGDRMRQYSTDMQEITREHLARRTAQGVTSIDDLFREITLDVILRKVFGAARGAGQDRLRHALRSVLDLSATPLALASAFVPRWLRPLTRWKKFQRLRAEIDEAIYAWIRVHRSQQSSRDDILSLLMEADTFDDRELRDHLVTMVSAGHETTAIALSWAVEDIWSRPELLSALRDELKDGYDGAQRGTPYPLLDGAVRETLRLHPVLPFVVRIVKRPFECRGQTWEPGTILCPCMTVVHRSPDVYPDPHAYRPQRFQERRFGPHEWFPFGGGLRMCTGWAFAMAEMRAVLATLIQETEMELVSVPSTRVRRRGVTLAPRNGPRIRWIA
jgi:cytochrome P450